MWRGARWWTRTALVLAVLIAGERRGWRGKITSSGCFNPLPQRHDARDRGEARSSTRVDLVLGVTLNGEAAAYPIRQLAYHHVVQDVVGGVPIVVTY